MDIQYDLSALQTGAVVTYLDKSGKEHTVAFMTPNPSEKGDGEVSFLTTINCQGGCGCRERVNIDPDGSMSYECTCNECVMDITL